METALERLLAEFESAMTSGAFQQNSYSTELLEDTGDRQRSSRLFATSGAVGASTFIPSTSATAAPARGFKSMSALVGERAHVDVPLTSAVSDAVAELMTDSGAATGQKQQERVSSSRAVGANSMSSLMLARDSDLQLVISESSTPTASTQMLVSGEPIAAEQPASGEELQQQQQQQPEQNENEEEQEMPLVTASMPNLDVASSAQVETERRRYSSYCMAAGEEAEAEGNEEECSGEEGSRSSTPRADEFAFEHSAFDFAPAQSIYVVPSAGAGAAMTGAENSEGTQQGTGVYDNDELDAIALRHRNLFGKLHDTAPHAAVSEIDMFAPASSCPQLVRIQNSSQDEGSLDSLHI